MAAFVTARRTQEIGIRKIAVLTVLDHAVITARSEPANALRSL